MTHDYTPAEGYGQILGSPPSFEAGDTANYFFLFYAGLLVVVLLLPWCLYTWRKKGDILPLAMLAGGFLTSLVEPMLDVLGHLRWASDAPGPAFHNFGIDIPLLIPPCYAAFAGIEAYFVCRFVMQGISRRSLMTLMAMIGLSDAIMEHPGLILNVYEYYGYQPFKFYEFPFWYSFTNAAAFVTIGVLASYAWPRLVGWRKIGIVLVGPVGMMMSYGVNAMPVYLGINSNLPEWAVWCTGAITCAFCVTWVRILGTFVCVENPAVEITFRKLARIWTMLPWNRERAIAEGRSLA